MQRSRKRRIERGHFPAGNDLFCERGEHGDGDSQHKTHHQMEPKIRARNDQARAGNEPAQNVSGTGMLYERCESAQE